MIRNTSQKKLVFVRDGWRECLESHREESRRLAKLLEAGGAFQRDDGAMLRLLIGAAKVYDTYQVSTADQNDLAECCRMLRSVALEAGERVGVDGVGLWNEAGRGVSDEWDRFLVKLKVAGKPVGGMVGVKGAAEAEPLSLDARAVAALADNMHFTKVTQVARFLSVTHQALDRKKCPQFRAAFDRLMQSPPPPRGYKTDDDEGGQYIEAAGDDRAKPSHRQRNRLRE